MNPSNSSENSNLNMPSVSYGGNAEVTPLTPNQTNNALGIEQLNVNSPSKQSGLSNPLQVNTTSVQPGTYSNTQGLPYTRPTNNNLIWQQSISDDPKEAGDNNRIEKPWVTKLKQIIANTKDDPHAQTESIVRVRADYIRKRYNKDIKLNNE